jgi:predicted nucleic acid-binding protein
VLTKPLRADPDSHESVALLGLLSRLNLKTLDEPTAHLAVALGVSYGLRAADAAHLATAIAAGADRFLTNNRRDFPMSISEIAIVYPDQLDD